MAQKAGERSVREHFGLAEPISCTDRHAEYNKWLQITTKSIVLQKLNEVLSNAGNGCYWQSFHTHGGALVIRGSFLRVHFKICYPG
jgi:hypothetical protein